MDNVEVGQFFSAVPPTGIKVYQFSAWPPVSLNYPSLYLKFFYVCRLIYLAAGLTQAHSNCCRACISICQLVPFNPPYKQNLMTSTTCQSVVEPDWLLKVFLHQLGPEAPLTFRWFNCRHPLASQLQDRQGLLWAKLIEWLVNTSFIAWSCESLLELNVAQSNRLVINEHLPDQLEELGLLWAEIVWQGSSYIMPLD